VCHKKGQSYHKFAALKAPLNLCCFGLNFSLSLLLCQRQDVNPWSLDGESRVEPIERLECRHPQKCFLIWNYYVGCLWAPLSALTHSKETVFHQIWCFYNKNKILTILFIVKYEKITLLIKQFLVLLGPIISRFFHVQMRGKK